MTRYYYLQEPETSIIDLPDDDPLPVEVMINVFYKPDITQPKDASEAITFNTKLFALADKRDVSSLKQFISKKYEQKVTTDEPHNLVMAVSAAYSIDGTKEL